MTPMRSVTGRSSRINFNLFPFTLHNNMSMTETPPEEGGVIEAALPVKEVKKKPRKRKKKKDLPTIMTDEWRV